LGRSRDSVCGGGGGFSYRGADGGFGMGGAGVGAGSQQTQNKESQKREKPRQVAAGTMDLHGKAPFADVTFIILSVGGFVKRFSSMYWRICLKNLLFY
jgi:hypothetical protein